MEIDALKYRCTKSKTPPVREEIDAGRTTGLSALKEGDLPVVYVVRNSDLPLLRQHTESVEECGRQESHMELWRILGKTDKMQLLQSKYDACGRVEQGIYAFLDHFNRPADAAEAMKKRNVFFIGIKGNIFDQLCKACQSQESTVTWTGKPGDDRTFPGSFMKLMGCEPVPAGLTRRYIGTSVDVEFVRQMIIRAAASDTAVLIVGDTGTGKEIVARQIHEYSGRKGYGDFVAINCGALTEKTLESELFGHEKGAFTDAYQLKRGLWEIAGQGTLFLDEIGDLSLDHQVKILRALQEGRIRRVGGEKEIPVGARIITATNRDLAARVDAGQFRDDLYFRIRQLIIRTPSLKSHIEDIPLLAHSFWRDIRGGTEQHLSGDLIAALQNYSWPGNVRELKSVLNSLHSLFRPVAALDVTHLEAIFQLYGQWTGGTASGAPSDNTAIECLRHLRRVLDAVDASEYALRSIIYEGADRPVGGDDGHQRLRYRLEELELLCADSDLFSPVPAALESVNLLNARLALLGSRLREHPDTAFVYWEENIKGLVNQARSVLLKACGDVMGRL